MHTSPSNSPTETSVGYIQLPNNVSLELSQILYLHGENNYTIFFYYNGTSNKIIKHTVSKTLKTYESLSSQFLRINQDCIINTSQIKKAFYEKTIFYFEVTDTQILKSSRRRKNIIKQSMEKHKIKYESAKYGHKHPSLHYP